MHDVICVNVLPPQVNGIPLQQLKGVTGASPTTHIPINPPNYTKTPSLTAVSRNLSQWSYDRMPRIRDLFPQQRSTMWAFIAQRGRKPFQVVVILRDSAHPFKRSLKAISSEVQWGTYEDNKYQQGLLAC